MNDTINYHDHTQFVISGFEFINKQISNKTQTHSHYQFQLGVNESDLDHKQSHMIILLMSYSPVAHFLADKQTKKKNHENENIYTKTTD